MPRPAPLLLCVLFLASPAGAEFYRWQDASGRERFAQELHQVPREHRAAAKAAAKQRAGSGGGAVNYLNVPTRAARPGSAPAAAQAAPAAPAPGGASFDCADLKRQLKKKRKVIRTHEGSVAANERWADDIEKSAFSRRKYELRAEEEERWLAKAEADLDDFLEAQRVKGVSPGCLR